ncbi:MAG TPA: hypothetical protein V6D05_04115 [Stenomitos sp.]
MKRALYLTALSVGMAMLATAPALAEPVVGVVIKPTVVVAPVQREPERRVVVVAPVRHVEERVIVVDHRRGPHWHGHKLHYGDYAPGQYRPAREVVVVRRDRDDD